MGSSPSLPQDKHVVVVGAGYGGIALCLELQRMGIPYTLISPRDYMHHNVAALRAVVVKGKTLTNITSRGGISVNFLPLLAISDIDPI